MGLCSSDDELDLFQIAHFSHRPEETAGYREHVRAWNQNGLQNERLVSPAMRQFWNVASLVGFSTGDAIEIGH